MFSGSGTPSPEKGAGSHASFSGVASNQWTKKETQGASLRPGETILPHDWPAQGELSVKAGDQLLRAGHSLPQFTGCRRTHPLIAGWRTVGLPRLSSRKSERRTAIHPPRKPPISPDFFSTAIMLRPCAARFSEASARRLRRLPGSLARRPHHVNRLHPESAADTKKGFQ